MLAFACSILVTWEGVLLCVVLYDRFVVSTNAREGCSRLTSLMAVTLALSTVTLSSGLGRRRPTPIWESLLRCLYSLVEHGLRHLISIFAKSHRAPTTGGQYHWVSIMGPKSSRKFLSYVIGKKSRVKYSIDVLTEAARLVDGNRLGRWVRLRQLSCRVAHRGLDIA